MPLLRQGHNKFMLTVERNQEELITVYKPITLNINTIHSLQDFKLEASRLLNCGVQDVKLQVSNI